MERRFWGERIENSAVILNTVSKNSHGAGECFQKGRTFDCDLIGIVSGGYEYHVDGKPHVARAGELFFIPAGREFSGRALEDSVHYFCHFSAGELNFPAAGVLRDGEIVRLFLRAAEEGDAFCLKCAVRLTLYRVVQYGENSGYGDIPAGIRRAVERINRDLGHWPTGAELAAVAGMNYSYFSRRFRECMGLSPVAYRDHVRMEEAKRLLMQGVNVKQTAEALGFSDMFAFSKKFKKHFRISPSGFRRIDV